MPEPVLQIEKRAGVTVLTLNRPSAMNALSRDLRRAIVDAFLRCDPVAMELAVAGHLDTLEHSMVDELG